MAEEVCLLTAGFPVGERFGLVSQMDRATVSIPSNIAEGSGREATQDLSRRWKDGQKDEKFRHYCLLPDPCPLGAIFSISK